MTLDLLSPPTFKEYKWERSSGIYTPKQVKTYKSAPYSNGNVAAQADDGYFSTTTSSEHEKHLKELLRDYQSTGMGKWDPPEKAVIAYRLKDPKTYKAAELALEAYRAKYIARAKKWALSKEPLRYNEMLEYDSHGQKADTKPRRNVRGRSSCIEAYGKDTRGTIWVKYFGNPTHYTFNDGTGKGLEIMGRQVSLGAFTNNVRKFGSQFGISIRK